MSDEKLCPHGEPEYVICLKCDPEYHARQRKFHESRSVEAQNIAGEARTLRLVIRMAKTAAGLVPMLHCSESGRLIEGQIDCEIAADAEGVSSTNGVIFVGSHFHIKPEKGEP